MKRWLFLAAAFAGAACGGEDGALVASKPTASSAPRGAEALEPETAPFAVAEPPPTESSPETHGSTTDPARLVYSHVTATVRGDSVTTEVSDVVVNDGSAPVDFTYRFPLPGDATVTSFAYFRDGKRVEAKAREKSQAKSDFVAAKAAGKTAALAEGDGNSRFVVALSPLQPGESRRVELNYLQTLDSFGATRSYVFPAAHSEHRGEPVLDMEVHIASSARIERLESLNHPDARIVSSGETRASVLLERTGAALGQDLALRWSERSEPLDLSLRAVAGDGGEPGFGEVDFAFNADPFAESRPARDFVFVIDTSLSMAGEALEHAKHLVERATAHLSERDRLALVTFDDSLSSWDAPLPATPAVKDRALAELRPKHATGLSNVDAAIDRAAELVRGREQAVVLFVTDGQSTVGNALDELSPASSAKDFAQAQVFVALVNYPSRQPLLEKLFPRATLRFVPGGKAGEELSESMAELVAAPVLENVTVTIDGLATERRHGKVADRLPLGERIRVLGRLSGPPLYAKVTGTLHGRAVAFEKRVEPSAHETDRSTLPRAWARARIAELEQSYGETRDEAVKTELVALGSHYGLVSSVTSLLAVDSLSPDRIAPGDPEVRVRAPRSLGGVRVELPWGESVSCSFDEREDLWLGRFLVPRSTPDGLYRARIFTEQQARTALRGTLPFRVDSKPPRFRLRAERRGTLVELVAEPEGDVFDGHGDSIRLDLVDVKDVSVRLDGERIALARSGEREWRGSLARPAAGRHALSLVATDYAQNGSELAAMLTVPASETKRLVVTGTSSKTTSASASSGAPDRASRGIAPARPRTESSSATCFFGKGNRRQHVLTRTGRSIELFDGFLRVDGRELTPCNGLPASDPTSIAAFGGGFAVGFRAAGVFFGEDGRFRAIGGLPADAVTALAEDGAERLFVGTARRGVFRFTEGVNGATPLAGELSMTGITALAFADGRLHAGLAPRGYVELDTRVDGAAPRHVSQAAIGCFRPAATTDRGALLAVPPGSGCHDAVTAGTLPSANVTALTVHSGRLVVGTFSAGAYELDAKGEPSPIDGAPRFVNDLLSDGAALWFATANGLFRRLGAGVEPVPLPESALHVNSLARGRDGTLWLATGGGVVGIRGGDVRVLDERQGLPSRIAYAVTESDDGTLWVGTAAGVARVGREGVETFTLEDGRLP
ncbi:MAG TPA: VIT domain-containing protein, partial [Polyangiaceae bacterium]